MRPSSKSRSRGRSNNGGNPNAGRSRLGNIVNRVFESAGPEGKVRGTPQQIIDKYQALARDAQLSNDRVAAESFLQHAEHYSRMLAEAQRQQQDQQQNNQPRADRAAGPEEDEQQAQGAARPQADGQRRDARLEEGSPAAVPGQGQRNAGAGSVVNGHPVTPPVEAAGFGTIDPPAGATDADPVDTPEAAAKPTGRARATSRRKAAAEANGHDQGDAAARPDADGPDATPKPARRSPVRRRTTAKAPTAAETEAGGS